MLQAKLCPIQFSYAKKVITPQNVTVFRDRKKKMENKFIGMLAFSPTTSEMLDAR